MVFSALCSLSMHSLTRLVSFCYYYYMSSSLLLSCAFITRSATTTTTTAFSTTRRLGLPRAVGAASSRASCYSLLLSSSNSMSSSSSSSASTTRLGAAAAATTSDDHRRSFSSLAVKNPAKIIALAQTNDDANDLLVQSSSSLPAGAELLQIGSSLADFDLDQLKKDNCNVVFVSYVDGARETLAQLIANIPSLQWIHCRSAGIDFVMSPELSNASHICMTNAKGQFSSTLAEYTMLACSYFAKNVNRLAQQKNEKEWKKYDVCELRGATLGVIGYGDIGRACAKLAKVYGMRVIALRRNPLLCSGDPLCDAVYSSDTESLNRLMSESDYILVSAPLTEQTRGLISTLQFRHAKQDAVFINVGRGPVVDEDALIVALKKGQLKGAALDVFTEEPLPQASELWELPNVLLSPHNMDQTATFMHEATEFFVEENLPRFVRGEELLNEVDKVAGY